MGSRYRPVSEMSLAEFVGTLAYELGRQGAESAASFKFNMQDPFDPVMKPIYQLREFNINTENVKPFLGAGLMGWGTAMAIPGPVDFAFGVAGTAAFKHPAGGVAAVVAYNVFAAGVFGLGFYLSTS